MIEAADRIKELHKRKNDDYAKNDNPFFNFDVAEYGLRLFPNPRDGAFAGLIFTKLGRLAVLLLPGAKVNNESIEDTFLDLATYTLLWRADFIRRRKLKEELELPPSERFRETAT